MTFLDYTFFNVVCFYFIFLINSDEIIKICGELPFNYVLTASRLMLHV